MIYKIARLTWKAGVELERCVSGFLLFCLQGCQNDFARQSSKELPSSVWTCLRSRRQGRRRQGVAHRGRRKYPHPGCLALKCVFRTVGRRFHFKAPSLSLRIVNALGLEVLVMILQVSSQMVIEAGPSTKG